MASRSSTRSTAAAPSGEDLRDMPLGDRKKRLAGLLGRRRIGIV
jgi:ATP-dependent DNA ligase